MDVLQSSVLEWIQGERVPISRAELVREIMRLSGYCDLWPVATASQWHEAIDAVVKQSLITELNGKLRLAVIAETQPEAKETQLDLF